MEDLGAGLRQLAAADPLDPIDAAALVERGRRGRQRRKVLAVTGVVSAVAAIAVAANLLPTRGTAGRAPEVAGRTGTGTSQTPMTSSAMRASDFGSVPGVPRGEAALTDPLPAAETTRRCKLRYNNDRKLRHAAAWSAGDTIMYQLRRGDPATEQLCTIPGGDKPSDELVAAARRDPLPSSPAGQLRNCSVQFWVDLTKWRVIVSETAPRLATSLVAVSPSGRHTVFCQLGPRPEQLHTATPFGSTSGFRRGNHAAEKVDENFGGIGGLEDCGGGREGWMYTMIGRVDPAIARLRIAPVGGDGVHDVRVRDGWYAVAWLNCGHLDPQARYTAYDTSGNVIKTVVT